MFMSTIGGACNTTVMEQTNTSYCWCVDNNKAPYAGTFSCDFFHPVDTASTLPTDTTYSWYDYEGTAQPTITCEEPTECKSKSYKIFTFYTIVFALLFTVFSQ